MQHVAIGYLPWVNLYWFPLLVWCFGLPRVAASFIGASAILAIILLQGGTHVFVWFALFIVGAGFFSWVATRAAGSLLRSALALALAGGLAWVRIAATSDAFSGFEQDFQPGYSAWNFLAWAIIPAVTSGRLEPFFLTDIVSGVPAWDGAVFWGFALPMAAILVIRPRCLKQETPGLGFTPSAVMVTSLLLLCMSFGPLLEGLIMGVNRVAE